MTVSNKSKMTTKEMVDIVMKEIGYPDTEEKVTKMAERIRELQILSELLV